MYSDTVLDHFKNPRNCREMEDADAVGTAGSAECGDYMSVYIKVKDNKIDDISFQTFGCAAAIASSSMFTVMAKGKTLEDAEKITNMDIVEALEGLPKPKIHCSVMAADGLRAAIEEYRMKQK